MQEQHQEHVHKEEEHKHHEEKKEEHKEHEHKEEKKEEKKEKKKFSFPKFNLKFWKKKSEVKEIPDDWFFGLLFITILLTLLISYILSIGAVVILLLAKFYYSRK